MRTHVATPTATDVTLLASPWPGGWPACTHRPKYIADSKGGGDTQAPVSVHCAQ